MIFVYGFFYTTPTFTIFSKKNDKLHIYLAKKEGLKFGIKVLRNLIP